MANKSSSKNRVPTNRLRRPPPGPVARTEREYPPEKAASRGREDVGMPCRKVKDVPHLKKAANCPGKTSATETKGYGGGKRLRY